MMLFLGTAKLSRLSIAFIILLAVFNLNTLATTLYEEKTVTSAHEKLFNTLKSLNISQVKTNQMLIINYSGQTNFKSVSTIFPFQTYSHLNNKEIVFVDEYTLPYHISNEESNKLMIKLPEKIWKDSDECKDIVDSLKSKDIEALIYVFEEDDSVPFNFTRENLLDSDKLSLCDLEVLSESSGHRYSLIIYRIMK